MTDRSVTVTVLRFPPFPLKEGKGRTMKQHIIKPIGLLIAIEALTALSGCAANAASDLDQESQVGETAAALEEAKIVASLELEGGHTISFYDFKLTAVIAEEGPSYSKPKFDWEGEGPDQLGEIWQRLAPHRKVPHELVQLQERLTQLSEDDRRLADQAQFEQHSVPVIDGEGAVASTSQALAADCGNGCCNFDWITRDFAECNPGLDFDIMRFNAQGSVVEKKNVEQFFSFVCSAVGTHRYTMSFASLSSSRDVPAARFLRTSGLGRFDPWACGGGWCPATLRDAARGVGSSSRVTHCVRGFLH